MSPILLLTADRSPVFTATVVISGILIVVGVLFLLIGVFNLFGKIVPMIEKRTRAREEKSKARKAERAAKRLEKKAARNGNAALEPVMSKTSEQVMLKSAPKPAPVVEQGISGEVVAAITAAIVATEGQGAVIRSIKKKNVGGRNPWSQAATIDNTRPF